MLLRKRDSWTCPALLALKLCKRRTPAVFSGMRFPLVTWEVAEILRLAVPPINPSPSDFVQTRQAHSDEDRAAIERTAIVVHGVPVKRPQLLQHLLQLPLHR